MIKKEFYLQDTEKVAQELLGCQIVINSKSGKVAGKIVETEAYLFDDPASHSYKGRTNRNKHMFGDPGTAYIYLIYGMHHCFNIVTQKQGVGEAVLIRALEPLSGLDIMKRNRKKEDVRQLCNGPAKLAQALGINPSLSGLSLKSKEFYIIPRKESPNIVKKSRVGITKGQDLKLRFYIKNSPFISKK